MIGRDDGSFAIELEGTFCTFGYDMEGDEVTRAKELMDEIERRVVGLRDKMWGLPPETKAYISKLEAENTRLKQQLKELAQTAQQIADRWERR